MFYGASKFNKPLDKWRVGWVEDMSYMFYGAKNFDQYLDKWKVHKDVKITKMFEHSGFPGFYKSLLKGLIRDVWGLNFDNYYKD